MAVAQFHRESSGRDEFTRQPNRFTDRISRASTSPSGGGPDDQSRWPVEPGRYRLIWSPASPWAHRAVIVRRVLGLEDAISLGTVDPIRDDRGWRFALDPEGRDPVLGVAFLAESYRATDPDYTGPVTVPALIDTRTGRVVSNDYPRLTLDLSTEWSEHRHPDAPDLYPAEQREEMDALMAEVYRDVNEGVYRCGVATSQDAYEAAYRALFDRLDALDDRLADQRYLMGESISEADVRFFPTLVRFDVVYHHLFRCNRNKLTEMPVLWAYARDLYSQPGFGDTVDFGGIKQHYYRSHHALNPSGIIPAGPELAGWQAPHGRG